MTARKIRLPLTLRHENPYLLEAQRWLFFDHESQFGDRGRDGIDSIRERHALVAKYAWAVPSDLAIDTCVKYSPIVDVGAGFGYWAHVLSKAGADVLAFDRSPGVLHGGLKREQSAPSTWFDVQQGDAAAIAARYPARTLMLCWPPYDTTMALDALRTYTGQHVIYIGEGRGGCTADDAFHDLLTDAFDEIEDVRLPQWWGIHDSLSIYRRKEQRL